MLLKRLLGRTHSSQLKIAFTVEGFDYPPCCSAYIVQVLDTMFLCYGSGGLEPITLSISEYNTSEIHRLEYFIHIYRCDNSEPKYLTGAKQEK